MKNLTSDTAKRPLYNSLRLARVVLVLLAMLGWVGCNDKEPPVGYSVSPKVAEVAPDFSLTGLDGKSHRLSDFKGQVVFLNFWATWCAPCVLEMPSIERLYQSLKDKGLTVITINTDDSSSEEKVKKFVDTYGLNFKILRDPNFSVLDSYRVSGFPETFLIDREGKFLSFKDPKTDSDLVRIISDRPWDSAKYLKELEKLL